MSKPCVMCGGPVNPHDMGTWKEVVGWVGGPRKDSMRLRKDTERYAHNHCVEKLASGQAIDQPEITDERPEVVRPHDGTKIEPEVKELFDD